MKKAISKIKHIIWIIRYIYWNRMKVSLDTFGGGTQEIEMSDIVSISIAIINGTKQICIILRGQTEALHFPLTAHNLSWFQGFIINWTNDDICTITTTKSSGLGFK